MTPRKWMSDIFCAESKEVQHISIGHDSGGELRILLQKSSSPKGGICCFSLKTMSVTPYMMLVPPLRIRPRGNYAARYSTSLNPMYYFWSKCEWEVLVTPWISPRESEKKKIDVCWQIMNNWDVFVDYTWANRKKL
jgi:hypothetical protein